MPTGSNFTVSCLEEVALDVFSCYYEDANLTFKSMSNLPPKMSGEAIHQTSDEQADVKSLLNCTTQVLNESGNQWNIHLISSLRRQTLSRILYYNELYQHIIDVPGVICEFGIQWGATMALLQNLRGIYEPFNFSRKIIGFDTFTGFPSVNSKDGEFPQEGDYSTGEEHFDLLVKMLSLHEKFSPISHIQKYELIKGDACITFEKWLENNPAAIISMAILDFDIYNPTKAVLSRLVPRLTKGSLLVFDELSCPYFPGETLAVMETIGLGALRLRRHPHQPWCAYAIWE